MNLDQLKPWFAGILMGILSMTEKGACVDPVTAAAVLGGATVAGVAGYKTYQHKIAKSPSLSDDIIEHNRKSKMVLTGHECRSIDKDGNYRECVPFRIFPVSAKYGKGEKWESERAMQGFLRACGVDVHPWCKFWVSNEILGYDAPSGSTIDPLPGVTKQAVFQFRCVRDSDGLDASSGHIIQKGSNTIYTATASERHEVLISCTDKYKTFYTPKKNIFDS